MEQVACNLCGADDAEPLYSLQDHRLRIDDRSWTVVRCRRCRLGYLCPRPTQSAIGRYYPGNYYAHRGDARSHQRYAAQIEHLPPPAGLLLDVGTAGADFLRLLRERGWQAFGLEPFASTLSASTSPVVRGRFPQDSPFRPETFDVITAWAVFEHLHDPRAAFVECQRLLRPGGLLVLQVPNLASVYGRYSWQEDLPRHLYFFSPRTLRRYGDAAGLELIDVRHTTNIFGGSGRGTLRLWLLRALRRPTGQYFELLESSRQSRRDRLGRLGPLWYGLAAVERMVLADVIVRGLRISGQVVAVYRKGVDTKPQQ